jgi:hypothetical protein
MAMAEAGDFERHRITGLVQRIASAIATEGETARYSADLGLCFKEVARFVRGVEDAMEDAARYEEARRCLAGELYGWVPGDGRWVRHGR